MIVILTATEMEATTDNNRSIFDLACQMQKRLGTRELRIWNEADLVFDLQADLQTERARKDCEQERPFVHA